MSMFRQIRPGGCVRAAGMLALLCAPLSAFAAKTGGPAPAAYSHAELLLDDLRSVPSYELGPKQYLLVIGAFEEVVETSPKHPKNDHGLLVTGELYEELSERFKDPAYRDKAASAYRALAARFPKSPFRSKALASLRGLGIDMPTKMAADSGPAPVKETGGKIPRPVKFSSTELRTGRHAVLRRVRHWSQKDYTRVVIELDDATDIRYDRIQGPERLFFDFIGARLDRTLRPTSTIRIGDGLVQRVRAGQNHREVARVVFDLDFRAHFTTSWLTNPPRLVVEMHRRPQEALAGNPVAAQVPRLANKAEERVEPDLLASAKAAGEISPTPQDRLAQPVPEDTALADPASEPLETREYDGRPGVTSEEIVPAFLQEAAATRPMRERFEPVHVEQPISSKRAVVAESPPVVAESPVGYAKVALGLRQEQIVLAKLEPPAAPNPAAEESTLPPVLDLPSPKPAKTTSSGKRNLIRTLGLKVGKVVIDPGHGGHDTGTVGAGKLREKDLVNDLAQRLGSLIEERLGSEVIYTRTDDRFVPLRERTRMANHAQADLFISIHANSARQRSVRGIETYYLNLTTDSWAMAVAARENAAAERSVHELEDLVAKITRNENLSESREFASKVQSALYDTLSKQTRGLRNRGVRKAPMLVLMDAKMPAVLAEVSFLSNTTDEKLLKTSAYRDKVAEALFKGISSYADTLSSITEKTTTTAGLD